METGSEFSDGYMQVMTKHKPPPMVAVGTRQFRREQLESRSSANNSRRQSLAILTAQQPPANVTPHKIETKHENFTFPKFPLPTPVPAQVPRPQSIKITPTPANKVESDTDPFKGATESATSERSIDEELLAKRISEKIRAELKDFLPSQKVNHTSLEEFHVDDLKYRIHEYKESGIDMSPGFDIKQENDKRKLELEHWRMKMALEEREIMDNCNTFVNLSAHAIEGFCKLANIETIYTDNLSSSVSTAIHSGRFRPAIRYYTSNLPQGSILKNPIYSFVTTFASVLFANHMEQAKDRIFTRKHRPKKHRKIYETESDPDEDKENREYVRVKIPKPQYRASNPLRPNSVPITEEEIPPSSYHTHIYRRDARSPETLSNTIGTESKNHYPMRDVDFGGPGRSITGEILSTVKPMTKTLQNSAASKQKLEEDNLYVDRHLPRAKSLI